MQHSNTRAVWLLDAATGEEATVVTSAALELYLKVQPRQSPNGSSDGALQLLALSAIPQIGGRWARLRACFGFD